MYFLTFILIFTQAIALTRVINNYRMMSRPNYLPGMSYILITSFFAEWNFFSAPLLLNSLLIFILGWLFKIYNHPRAKAIIFNIGLAIGISTFIFFPSLSFILWVLFALMIMRPFRINEWLLLQYRNHLSPCIKDGSKFFQKNFYRGGIYDMTGLGFHQLP